MRRNWIVFGRSRLGELVQMKSDPSQIADILTVLALNGKDNPYGYPGLGH